MRRVELKQAFSILQLGLCIFDGLIARFEAFDKPVVSPLMVTVIPAILLAKSVPSFLYY